MGIFDTISNFFTGDPNKQVTTQSTSPWGPQASGLQAGWSAGTNLFNQRMADPSRFRPTFGGTTRTAIDRIGGTARGFDSGAYLSANPDVARSGMDPWAHFNQHGRNEGRAMPTLRDLSGTASGTLDDISSGRSGIGTGGMFQKLSRSAEIPGAMSFDRDAYLRDNPDVAASGMDPLQHYQNHGRSEGRSGGMFSDVASGRRLGTDAGWDDVDAGARGSGFLASGMYNDVATGRKLGTDAGWDETYDSMEGPGSLGFDREAYLRDNPDVAAAGVDPLQHYQTFGRGEGRSAGMFSDVASGKLLDSNPHREALLKQSLEDTERMLKADMGTRLGSSFATRGMAEGLGRVATQHRAEGYEADMDRMLGAAQARSGEELARTDRRLSATSGRSGEALSRIQAAMAAAEGRSSEDLARMGVRLSATQGRTAEGLDRLNTAVGAGQARSEEELARLGIGLDAARGATDIEDRNLSHRLTATGMTPAISDMRYADTDRLLKAGLMEDELTESGKNWDLDMVSKYLSMFGGDFGSNTMAPEASPFMKLLGATKAVGETAGSIFSPFLGGK
jgi:hypothetical protein